MGVNKLTGMNSAAISSATHIAMDPTALQFVGAETEAFVTSVLVVVCVLVIFYLQNEHDGK